MLTIEVTHDELARALKLAGKTTSRQPAVPVLGGVRLEVPRDTGKLEITATDLELTSRTVLDPVEVSGHGIVVVPLRELAAAIKGRRPKGATVALWHDETHETLRVSVGGMVTSLQLLDAEDWPTPTISDSSSQLVTSSLELITAWATRVLPACSDDEDRPVLTAVHVQRKVGPQYSTLTAAACDSYRLHVYETVESHGDDCSFLLPARALRLAVDVARTWKAGTAVLRYGDGRTSFWIGRTVLAARTVEGEFPDWRELLPTTFDGATLAITDVAALRPMLDMAADQNRRDRSGPIRLEQAPDGSVLGTMQTQDVSTIELPMTGLKISGDVALDPVAYNARYLRDIIVANGEGTMRFQPDGARKPAVLEDGNGFQALLMPVLTS